MQATRSPDFSIRLHARRVLQVTLAGLALTGTGAALAADPPKAPAQQMAQGMTDKAAAEAAFVRADADKDGKLSKAEASGLPAIAQRFEDLDKDRDGNLSMPEYMAAFGATK
jgi:EF hand